MAPPLEKSQEKILHDIYYDEKQFFGRDRIYAIIQERDIDISRRQVMEWLKKQEVHQLTSQTRRSNVIQPTILTEPLKQLGIDLIDMQNLEHKTHKYVLTCIDLFSKKAYAVPLKNKEGKTVAVGMEKIIKDINKKISSIRSDNGSEFISSDFKKVLEKYDIKQVFSLASKPQSNGQIERFNAVIKKLIRKSLMVSGGYDWVSILPELLDNYNNSKHDTTGKTPNSITEKDYEEVTKKISSAVLKHRDTDKAKYEVGQTVRIKMERTTKEDYNWSKELYEIIKVNSPKNNISAVSYQVKDKETKEKMKDKFYNNDLLLINAIENPIKVPEKYVVSSLLRPSVQKGVQGYVVKWKGYVETTFEPRDQLIEDVPKIVNAFEKKHQVEWLDNGRFKWKQ